MESNIKIMDNKSINSYRYRYFQVYITGVSSPTIYRVLKEDLGYVSNRLVKPEETNASK